jgi:hypothetical protein
MTETLKCTPGTGSTTIAPLYFFALDDGGGAGFAFFG